MIGFLKAVRQRNFGTMEFLRYCFTHLLGGKKSVPADEEAVSYGEHKDQCFDIWYGNLRSEDRGAPLLIFFHGGAFIKGRRFYSKLMRQAHGYGVTVISAGYRLSAERDCTIEDSIEDSARLLKFIRGICTKIPIL